jgi:hypothetical protein
MGGLFRAPKPASVPRVSAPTPAPATAPAVVPAPAPAPAVALPAGAPVAAVPATPEQAASDQRVQAQDMAGRGMQGMIATSPRGVLDPAATLPRKTLLGE